MVKILGFDIFNSLSQYMGGSLFSVLLMGSLKDIATLTLCAYPLTKMKWFQRLITEKGNLWAQIRLAAIWGMFSVLGVAIGRETFNGAIVNTGIVGSVVSGLIGGVPTGFLTGFIGGLFRLYMGGFAADSECVGFIVGGVLGGLLKSRTKRLSYKGAFVAGFLAALLHLGAILLIAQPFILAKTLVLMIGIIQVASSSLGAFMMIAFLNDVEQVKELTGAAYVEKSLEIATRTMPILKSAVSLDRKVAGEIADIIYSITNVDAVSISSGEEILAFCGMGSDHHFAGNRNTLVPKGINASSVEPVVLYGKEKIGCGDPGCMFNSSATVALPQGDEVFAYIGLFRCQKQITLLDIEMLRGTALLLSQQLDIARHEVQKKLLAKAEYSALKAQINPHFLFNTLNAIKMLIRQDPAKAQILIVDLSSFIRYNLKQINDLIPLQEEINVMQLYMRIQRARFGERLQVETKVDPQCQDVLFPSFCIQMLVENCMNHGLKNIEGEMRISVSAERDNGFIRVRIADNGGGFPENVLRMIRDDTPDKNIGIGLTNINRRLKTMFPEKHRFILENTDSGSQVTVMVPYNTGHEPAQSVPAAAGAVKQ